MQTLTRTLQESNAIFAEAVKAMSTSTVALSQSLQRSTEMMSQEQIPSQFLNRYQQFPRIYQHGHCINHQGMGMMGTQAKRNQEEDESDIYEFTYQSGFLLMLVARNWKAKNILIEAPFY